jgi:N-acetylglutamate synthase-like GNAT family acetyltransferase
VYLLTTTAAVFFARFGFERAALDNVPERVQSSPEFRGASAITAAVMRLRL